MDKYLHGTCKYLIEFFFLIAFFCCFDLFSFYFILEWKMLIFHELDKTAPLFQKKN